MALGQVLSGSTSRGDMAAVVVVVVAVAVT